MAEEQKVMSSCSPDRKMRPSTSYDALGQRVQRDSVISTVRSNRDLVNSRKIQNLKENFKIGDKSCFNSFREKVLEDSKPVDVKQIMQE